LLCFSSEQGNDIKNLILKVICAWLFSNAFSRIGASERRDLTLPPPMTILAAEA
jgi:hypothetical protein